MKRLIYMMTALLCLSGCMKDGEMLVATIEGNGTQIGTADGNIILTSDSANSLALTIYWDELGNASLSNPNAQLPDGVVINAVQFSTSAEFETFVEQSVESDATAVQFTVSALNNLLSGLGLEGGVATPIYVRMKTSLGSNSDTIYGNVLKINVTAYAIDMSSIRIAGVSGGAYTKTEVSIPAEEGVEGSYRGFANIPTGWWNCFFVEGNGNIWGSSESNGPFELDAKKDISNWNIWFPEPSGCYWIDIDVNVPEWECVSLSGVNATVGSAAPASMSYFRSEVTYYLVLTTTEDNVAIQTEFTGIYYNAALGTGSDQSVTFPIICNADGSLSVGESGASSGLTVASAGTYTLILRLEDMAWELAEGEVDVAGGGETINWPADDDYAAATSDYLYMYDKSGETVATLEKTSDGVYNGFFYMTGWFNFLFGDNEDSSAATLIYGSSPASEIDGALYRLFCGSDRWDIYWNSGTAAYVYLTVNTNTRTWSYIEVTSISIVGDFNSWSATSDVMSLNDSGIWTIDFTPGTWEEWGIEFLVNGSWDWIFAPDANGVVVASTEGKKPDVEISEGVSYTMTLDLVGMTWTCVETPSTPVYPSYLYVFYTWPSSGYWQEKYASSLYSPAGDGAYSGYFSSGTSWQTSDGWASPYVNFTLGSSETANSGTKYLVTDNTSLGTESGASGWVTGLGVSQIDASLVDMTLSVTYLGTPTVVTSSASTSLAFDDVTDYIWMGTVTFAAGDTFTVTVGETVTFGGVDGVLTLDGDPITVAEAGTYAVTVDLSAADALKYTLTLE